MSNIVALGAGEKGRLLLAQWQGKGGHTTSDSAADIGDADVVLIDVDGLGGTLDDIVAHLDGKIVIDCSNPPDISALQSRPSNAAEIARRCPGARVAKALNALDAPELAVVFKADAPSVRGAYMSAFFCTDDAQARAMVAGLLDEICLDPVDCGPLSNATLLDGVGLLDKYLGDNVFKPPFAIIVSHEPIEGSPSIAGCRA